MVWHGDCILYTVYVPTVFVVIGWRNSEKQGSHSLDYKNFPDFPEHQKHFPGPCQTPVMFKYKYKQQLLWGPGLPAIFFRIYR